MENDNLEMDIFMGEDFIEDNSELDTELDIIKPSEEDEKTPEIVASGKQDGEASTTSQESEEEEEEEESSAQPSLYSSLANVLYNEGALPNLDIEHEKIEDVDGLVNAIKKEIESNEYTDLTDRQKRYLEALRAGIPEEEFLETEKVSYNLENISDDFLENEENSEARAALIKDYFLLKGMDEDEAENLTQQQIDLATDIEFSKKAVKTIKEYNDQLLQDKLDAINAARLRQEQEFETLRDTIKTTDSVIEGMPINKKDKDGILEVLTKPVETLQDGTQLNTLMKIQREDPIKFQYNLAYLVYLTDGFKDFSKFTTVKRAKSSAIKDFEQVLKQSTLDLNNEGGFDADSIDLGDLNFNL